MIASESQSEALVIRAATDADMAGLCAVRNAPAAHGAKLREAANGTVKFLVATIRGEIVGFATLFLTNPTTGSAKSHVPKLSDCFVAASCRSRGIGRALVGARETLARLEGHRRLYVSVDPVENPRWLAFFQGRGYKALHDAPYRKREPRDADNGGVEEVLIWRQDLVMEIA